VLGKRQPLELILQHLVQILTFLYISGIFDGFNIYIAKKSASLLFFDMGLREDGIDWESMASAEKKKIKNRFPTTTTHPRKRFKVNIHW